MPNRGLRPRQNCGDFGVAMNASMMKRYVCALPVSPASTNRMLPTHSLMTLWVLPQLFKHLNDRRLDELGPTVVQFANEHFRVPDIRSVLCPGIVATILTEIRHMGCDDINLFSEDASLAPGAPLTRLLHRTDLFVSLYGGPGGTQF